MVPRAARVALIGALLMTLGTARRLTALVLAGALVAGLAGGSGPVLGAAGDPATIVFVGEVASAPSYDHIGVLFDKRLDQTVPVPYGDFTVTIDHVDYTPVGGSYVLAGLAGSGGPFDVSG